MKRIDLVHRDKMWIAKAGSKIVASAPVKKDAVHKTAKVAKADSKLVSVKIHKLNGDFQEERTYPRSADPRQSKG